MSQTNNAFTLLEMEYTCKRCGARKLASEFPKEPRNRSGLAGTCRACAKISRDRWVSDNPEADKASKQAWIERNPDKVAANRAQQLAKSLANTKNRRGETWGPRETSEGRRCSGCQLRKPRSAFGKCKSEADGLQSYCRDCANVRAMAHFSALNPEKKYHRGRKSNLKRNYGLTIEAYEAILCAQGNKCAICRMDLSESGTLKDRNSQVDHDHATGRVRGILCRTCNVGIGHLKENVGILEAAIVYLKRASGED